MEKQFIVLIGESQAKFRFCFRNEKLILLEVCTDTDLSNEQNNWIWNYAPRTIHEFRHYFNDQNPKVKMKVTEVPVDLSFDAFWKAYDYKVGKKDRVQKAWEALSEEDKGLCMAVIPKYNYWITTKPYEKAYPETFISQRRWENEFKA